MRYCGSSGLPPNRTRPTPGQTIQAVRARHYGGYVSSRDDKDPQVSQLQNQHRIAEAEKAIALFDRVGVGAAGALNTRKRHHQGE